MPLDLSRASFQCQDVDHNTNVDQGGMVHLEKRKEKREFNKFYWKIWRKAVCQIRQIYVL